MVLFAQERLGLGSVGFGLLSGADVGGTLGRVVAPWLDRRLGAVPVMLGGSILSGVATFGVGLTRDAWVAGAFRLLCYGAVPLGALLGGALARPFGLSAPFLVAGVAILVMTLLVLPFVNCRTVEHALAGAEERPVEPSTEL